MISFSCPNCKTKLQREDSEAGTKILCPSCNRRLLIPTPARLLDRTLDGRLPLEPEAAWPRQELVPVQPPLPEPPLVTAAPPPTGPPIRCSCPHCRRPLWFDAHQVGSRLPCSHCSLPVEIPCPKAVLRDEMPMPPPAPVRQPTSTVVVQPEIGHPSPGSRPSAGGDSVVNWLLLGVGMGLLLVVTFCVSFGVVFLIGVQGQADEEAVASVRNQITSLHSQLQAMEIELAAAIDRRDRQRVIALAEQAVAKHEEMARLQDQLAARSVGNDRDEYIRSAAHNRAEAQQIRLQVAQWRANQ